MRKIQCQDATCTSQPPSVGPTSGPTMPGTPTMLMAYRSFSRGKARSTASRPTGNNIAPPAPCSTRAAVSCSRLREAAHRIEPIVNITIAVMNARRRP